MHAHDSMNIYYTSLIKHSIACNANCATGLGRCTGPGSGHCCSAFYNGTCVAQCPANYTADDYYECGKPTLVLHVQEMIYHWFLLVCNISCDNGYGPNSDCSGCVLTDICLADNPCINGGTCAPNIAPDSYTCNCTGTGYTGVNCSDASNVHVGKVTVTKFKIAR